MAAAAPAALWAETRSWYHVRGASLGRVMESVPPARWVATGVKELSECGRYSTRHQVIGQPPVGHVYRCSVTADEFTLTRSW